MTSINFVFVAYYPFVSVYPDDIKQLVIKYLKIGSELDPT